MPFNYSLDFKKVDFRKNPELYRIGVGEQGVLLVEPYKSELLPYWRFKTPEIAQKSADQIYELFLNYLEQNDLVGADMARKYLQMGFTRSRRYANHKSGQKYAKSASLAAEKKQKAQTENLNYPYSSGSSNKNNQVLPQEEDWQNNEKAQSAEIFKQKWYLAKENEKYQSLISDHKIKYGR